MIGSQLQEAIYAALAPVAGGRRFDRVPKDSDYPYLTIGNDDLQNAGTTCGEAWTIYPDIHVWSRPTEGSKKEIKNLVAEIVPLLQVEFVLTGFTIIQADLESVRTFRDRDGLTEHSVITMRYEVHSDT